MTAIVPCPVCGTDVPWSEASRWRPFCSERCKLIDLGDWAAGRHVIAGDPVDPSATTDPEVPPRDRPH
ncbi:MAG: DNA gyrase inhibitor YacG [Burkholderiaceae bacterium]|nr:DNA gyrase inhibitor YacG [Burkholderiaceae bacterium]